MAGEIVLYKTKYTAAKGIEKYGFARKCFGKYGNSQNIFYTSHRAE